jgi:hypothetical protein
VDGRYDAAGHYELAGILYYTGLVSYSLGNSAGLTLLNLVDALQMALYMAGQYAVPAFFANGYGILC